MGQGKWKTDLPDYTHFQGSTKSLQQWTSIPSKGISDNKCTQFTYNGTSEQVHGFVLYREVVEVLLH